MTTSLNILLMDDDPEVLEQLKGSLPECIRGYFIIWHYCSDFSQALELIKTRRYDIVVTDIYRDSNGGTKGPGGDSSGALNNINAIRGHRFCPVIAFSDGSMPEGFKEGPFSRFADKASGNSEIENQLNALFDTGIPQIANKLHNELDGIGCNYLWDFLEKHWTVLKEKGYASEEILERLVRRRAATAIGRLDSKGVEVSEIAGAEFYIYPNISPGELRLGEILKDRANGSYRVILTPHCLLAIQRGKDKPKADFVLTIKAVNAADLLKDYFAGKDIPTDRPNQEKKVNPVIGASPSLGESPRGRYWFLPSFLQMPDLYCDFMQIESLPFDQLHEKFEAVAVLDTPFAESLQSRFGEFYASVGTPNLKPSQFLHLLPQKS